MPGDVAPPDVWFIYDGECPLCSLSATYYRLRESLGHVHLVNMRDLPKGDPLLREINARRFDLDQGMVVKIGDEFYHGADALHVLALLGSRSGCFNRLNAAIFRSKFMARLLYPALRAGRNLSIALKGAPRIRNLPDQ